MLDVKRDKIQKEAVEAWIEADKIGTIEAITGIGKNFIFITSVYTCPKGISVLFLAEQTDREKDILDDIKKYKKFYGKNLLKDYKFTFMTYQSAYKLKDTEWDFVCADEIHDGLSPAYSKFFFNNKYKYLIGLSATIMRNTVYENEHGEYTKGDLLDKIAPVCYKYSVDDGQKDSTARPLQINILLNRLDEVTKNIKAGSQAKPFYTTERANYNYWDEQFKRSLFISDEEKKLFRIRATSAARAKVLYKAPSKIKLVKKLLPKLKGKTLIFGNDLDSLLEITPNTISSRYSEVKNAQIREDFEKGKIDIIGSFKKLKQGANLSGLDNLIIMSYYSTSKDIIQRIGRLRKNGDKIGNVYIILTGNTQEEVWFNKMFEDIKAFKLNYLKL